MVTISTTTNMPVCRLQFDSDMHDYEDSAMDFDYSQKSTFTPVAKPARSRIPARHLFSSMDSELKAPNISIFGQSSYKGFSVSPSNSPPLKRINQLQLNNSPNTPKSLLSISSNKEEQPTVSSTTPHIKSKSCLLNKFKANPPRRSLADQINSNVISNSLHSFGSEAKKEEKNMRANVNPFTPDSIRLSRKRARRNGKDKCEQKKTPHNGSYLDSMDTACSSNLTPHSSEDEELMSNEDAEKRLLYSDDDDDSDDEPDATPCKRIAIQEVNVTRYYKEFAEQLKIGSGVFGSVFLCRHRLDGCLYAVKKSLRPVAGSSNERRAMNEVYAHAVLGAHAHVVRYYSAWAEDDHMVIQNEYCAGGSLGQAISQQRMHGAVSTERQARTVLLHVAKGLKYIHSLHMVHLDVKPDNVFIASEDDRHNTPSSQRHRRRSFGSVDDGFEDDTPSAASNTYKIGDLGHVTSVIDPAVEEGDCRYLAPEMLQDDYSDLPRVDVFALGLTIYEAATGRHLPQNGEEWHTIRNGNLPDIPGYSKPFQDLIKRMIHIDPSRRPTAAELVEHDIFREEPRGAVAAADSTTPTRPEPDQSSLRLQKELEEAQLKNQQLQAQLDQAKFYMQHLIPCSKAFMFTSPLPECNNNNSNNNNMIDNNPISITPMLSGFNNFMVSLEDKPKSEQQHNIFSNGCQSSNLFSQKFSSSKGKSPRHKHYNTRQQKKRRADDNGPKINSQLVGKKEVRSQSIY